MGPNWFIGFPVDGENWYETVITNAPAGIKCFHPLDLHLTFAFLGSSGEAPARKAWESAVKLNLSALSATLGSAEGFGNPKRPSAYAFTLDRGRDRMIHYIAAHSEMLLQVVGKLPARYKPRPHITIARPPRKASDALRAAGLAWMKSLTPPGVHIRLDRMALYTWADDRKERQFKVVEQISLN